MKTRLIAGLLAVIFAAQAGAAYIPVATDGTQPLDTVDRSTAAAEFRTLKTYIQATVVTGLTTTTNTANTASATATAANNTANTALANAATAQGTANTGVANAATAQATANTGAANAATAQAAANAAQSTANHADHTSSNAATGYMRFGDITIQWGTTTIANATAVTFPVAFSGAAHGVFITSAGTGACVANVNSKTNASFTATSYNLGAVITSFTYTWVAIGPT